MTMEKSEATMTIPEYKETGMETRNAASQRRPLR
jgi:hypothetical protein